MQKHAGIRVIMPRYTDVKSGMRDDNQIQIAGRLYDPQHLRIIDIRLLIGRVQLDPFHAAFFEFFQFPADIFVFRMHPAKSQDPLLFQRRHRPEQTVIYPVRLLRSCHNRKIDTVVNPCLLHGDSQAFRGSVRIVAALRFPGKMVQRPQGNLFRESMGMKIDNHR